MTLTGPSSDHYLYSYIHQGSKHVVESLQKLWKNLNARLWDCHFSSSSLQMDGIHDNSSPRRLSSNALQNVGNLPHHYTAPHSRKPQHDFTEAFANL